MDYHKLKVPELKALLQERQLAVSGNKADLIARLSEDDATKTTDAPAPAAANGADEEINWEDEAQPAAPAAEDAKPTEPPAPTDAAPSFSAGLAATDIDAELEKRRKRALKFGITDDTEAVKALERAKRFGGSADDKASAISMLDKELPERRAKRGAGTDGRGGKRQRGQVEPEPETKEDPVEAAKRAARAKKFGQPQ